VSLRRERDELVRVAAEAIARGQGGALSSFFPGPRACILRDAARAVDAVIRHMGDEPQEESWGATAEEWDAMELRKGDE
jgi:hypothetical protein